MSRIILTSVLVIVTITFTTNVETGDHTYFYNLLDKFLAWVGLLDVKNTSQAFSPGCELPR